MDKLNVPNLNKTSRQSSVQQSRPGSALSAKKSAKSSMGHVSHISVSELRSEKPKSTLQDDVFSLPPELSESQDSLLNIQTRVSSLDTRNRSVNAVENIIIMSSKSGQSSAVTSPKQAAL